MEWSKALFDWNIDVIVEEVAFRCMDIYANWIKECCWLNVIATNFQSIVNVSFKFSVKSEFGTVSIITNCE